MCFLAAQSLRLLSEAASRGMRVLIFTGIYKLFVSIWNELALKRQAKMVFAHVTRQTWHQGQNAMGGLCHGISFCHPSAGCLQCAAHELWLSLRSARWTPDCVASQASTEVTTHASPHSTRPPLTFAVEPSTFVARTKAQLRRISRAPSEVVTLLLVAARPT